MDVILYYIRDNLVGTYYFIYSFILLFLMFAMIGYLFKQRYGKLDVVLDTSQTVANNEKSSNTFVVPKEDDSSILMQSTRIQNLVTPDSPVEQKVEISTPTVIVNKDEQTEESINPIPSTNQELEIETPVKKEIKQDLIGEIPDI